MPKVNNTCARILTPKQVGPICWFMAAFVAMFYSQRSRKLLLNASKKWDTTNELFALLKHVLDDKYLKTASRESEDYRRFSDNTFGDVLSLLNKENRNAFPYNPKKVSCGFNPELYISKLYKLLGVDYKMFDYSTVRLTLNYSYMNDEYDLVKYKIENNRILFVSNKVEEERLRGYKIEDVFDHYVRYIAAPPPPILLIRVYDYDITIADSTLSYDISIYDSILPNNTIPEGTMNSNIKSRYNKITYNGIEYTLDSVILTNRNADEKGGHAIAGITCKKERYIYNGWTRTSMDPAMAKRGITRNMPCELMKYEWNTVFDYDICLNTTKCIPDILRTRNKKHYCFNFSWGRRVLIYVRNDAKSATSSSRSVLQSIPQIQIPTRRTRVRNKKTTYGITATAATTATDSKKSPPATAATAATTDLLQIQPRRRWRRSNKTTGAKK